MNKIVRYFVPALAVAFAMAGCHSNPNATPTTTPDQSQSQAQPAANDDPATANLAPASNTTETPQGQNPPAPPADQSTAPAPATGGTDQELPAPPPASEDEGETQTAVAPDPPPALPDYDQPEAPGDGYIWTPGYWAYAPQGYYWAPGAWVLAPYEGALWTPGYWGFYQAHYHFYHGYWGPHIGYYGGVNYGFGYVGVGYEGGYWRNNAFFYNTTVCRVNVAVIHNVYNYRIVNNYNTTRVAFVGGHGGLAYRPSPAQLVAARETHVAFLPAQRQLVHAAALNHAQFANVNHGRPAMFVEAHAVTGGRRAPAPAPAYVHMASGPAPGRPDAEARPEARQ